MLGSYFEVALHLAKSGVGILSRGGKLEIKFVFVLKLSCSSPCKPFAFHFQVSS